MDTRLFLQIALGVIIALVFIVGVLTIIALTGDAETIIVEEVAEEVDDEEEESPWAGLGDTAISLVQRVGVRSDPGVAGGADGWRVGALLDSEEFVAEKLKLTSGEARGWEAEWWGETRYGPTFYRVRYAFVDEGVTVGPTWLVNIDPDARRAVPKNVLAEVVTDPEKGVESDYFNQAQQVVSAIINHRFSADITLGGALLAYFQERNDGADEDNVLGWTVDHNRGQLFRAYFQWSENEELSYAEFEFDFEEHALRPVNLQANEIMQVGEGFEVVDRVDIMPASYDPSERIAANRWQGAAREQCRRSQHRDGCNALGAVLANDNLIETLEWLLTTEADTAGAFKQCQEDRICRWDPNEQEDRVYRISYFYDVGDGEVEIAWDVYLDDDDRLEPVDRLSELAYRAVHPRR